MKPPPFVNFGHLVQTKSQKKLPQHGIYSDNIYFFCLLTIFGLFPIHCNKNGIFQLNWKSWQTIYSIIYITLGSIFSVIGFKTVFQNLTIHSFGLQEFSFYSTFLCFPVLHFITIWTFCRGKIVADYFNDCTKFLIRFEHVTGKNAPNLHSSRWFIGTIIASMITLFFFFKLYDGILWMISLRGLEKNIHLALLIGEGYGVLAIFLLVGFFATIARCLKTMSKALLDDTLRCHSQNYSIEGHMDLWMNLRQLCLSFGDVFWMTYVYLSTCLVFMALPMIYTTANGLRRGEIISFLMAWTSICCVYLLAEIAHRLIDTVGNQFQKRLSSAMLEGSSNNSLREFVNLVASCPIVINLGGFFSLDRSLIVTITSTLITYLIIIMQFQLSWVVESRPQEAVLENHVVI